jgi:hypothetical protein
VLIPWVICVLVAIILIAAGPLLRRRSATRASRFIDSPAWQQEHWQQEHERERVAQQRNL